MRLPCPKCKVDFSVPATVLTKGVAHVTCEHCSFSFVVRLGDAGKEPAKKRDEERVELVGVKSSGSLVATAGEIGDSAPKTITEDTCTSIRVDPAFQQEIEQESSKRQGRLERAEQAAPRGGGAQPPPLPPPRAHTPVAQVAQFEAFRPVEQPPPPPPGAEVPTLQMAPPSVESAGAASAAPVYYYYPGVVPQPAGETPPQTESSGLRVVGLLSMILVGAVILTSLYVLYRNDWSLDMANIGSMLQRAFGGASPAPPIADELRGLEIESPENPIVEEARLATGERVLTVQGVVRNSDPRPHRFIYVEVSLVDAHGRVAARAEAPADNVFPSSRLATMTKARLTAATNPAGSDGHNKRVSGGEMIAFMVVVTPIPVDYAPGKYHFTAKVSQAELYDGP